MLPTRPQNIKKMITPRENGTRARVIPVVIPTVLMAEKVSNNASDSAKSCATQISSVPPSAS
jgi:hypothetical protein